MTDPNQLFLPILIDAVKDASLYPFSETYLPALQAFFGTVPPLLVAAAVFGAAVGGLTTWAIGCGLAEIRRRRPEFLSDAVYGPISFAMRKAGWLLVGAYTFPLGHALPLLAGFFGARWWQVALAMAIGRFWRYLYGY